MWFQLDWPTPVTFRQVVLHQFDTFVMELAVQVWDGAKGEWRTLRPCGEAGNKLPLVVAVDAGTVTSLVRQLAWAAFRVGTGGGLRLNTPVGPIRIDFGYALTPIPGEGRFQAYFSLGNPF